MDGIEHHEYVSNANRFPSAELRCVAMELRNIDGIARESRKRAEGLQSTSSGEWRKGPNGIAPFLNLIGKRSRKEYDGERPR